MSEYDLMNRAWHALISIAWGKGTPSLFAEYREETPRVFLSPRDERGGFDQWGRPLRWMGGDRWITEDQYKENGS